MAAGSVAYIPMIKVANPPLHLRSSNFGGFGNHPRQNFRIVNAGPPQFERQRVIFSDASCQSIQFGLGHAVSNFRANSKASHASDVLSLAQSPQLPRRAGTAPPLFLYFCIGGRLERFFGVE